VEKTIRMTPFESTLLLSGKTLAERGPVRLVAGIVNLPCDMPPRQRVSVTDFERDMRETHTDQ